MYRTFGLDKKENDFDIILSAVNKLVDFAKPTYGPANNNILLKRFGRVEAIDDGFIISQEFSVDNPKEQEVIDFIRSANRATNYKEGDGNVTTMLLLQGILNEYHKSLFTFFPKRKKDVLKELQDSAKQAIATLQFNKKEISTKKEIRDVARIAFNNKHIAELVSEIVLKIGKDGAVYTEEGSGMETTYSVLSGMEFDRGFVSPYMATNTDKEIAEIDNPLILITDHDIKSWKEIQTVIANCKEANKDLVIVCNSIEGDALEFIVENKLKKVHNTIAISAPELGERKADFLKDLAVISGGTVITAEKKIEQIKSFSELGQVDKVIVTNDTSKFIGGKGNKEDIEKRVEHLKSRLSEVNAWEEQRIKKEIASLLGGVAVIKIGAPTDAEMKALVPKVQNAVNSAHNAYKNGIVAGAGLALYNLATPSKIFNKAMKSPHLVLLENCEEKFVKMSINEAKNYTTGELGEFTEVGVVDPVNVLTTAINSAVSIACLLINNKGIIDNTNK